MFWLRSNWQVLCIHCHASPKKCDQVSDGRERPSDFSIRQRSEMLKHNCQDRQDSRCDIQPLCEIHDWHPVFAEAPSLELRQPTAKRVHSFCWDTIKGVIPRPSSRSSMAPMPTFVGC